MFFLSTRNNPFIIFFLSSFIAPPLSHTNPQTHTHTKQKITFINKVSSLMRATTHVHKLFFSIENNYATPFSCTNHYKSHLFKSLSRLATFQMTSRTYIKKDQLHNKPPTWQEQSWETIDFNAFLSFALILFPSIKMQWIWCFTFHHMYYPNKRFLFTFYPTLLTIQLSTNFMGQIVMVLGACCILKQKRRKKICHHILV